MLAPDRFVLWLDQHWHTDSHGHRYHYHPRSDIHSKVLAQLVWEDLYRCCPAIRRDSDEGRIIHNMNYRYQWPRTAKVKTIDLAVGTTAPPPEKIDRVLLSCELKAMMTEHLKSKPRIFDELGSSHLIVHAGDPDAIAAGLTVVNIASTFVSPLRQRGEESHKVTIHRQPGAARSVVEHLRGLPIRERAGDVGFDAYCTFVVDCDNVGPARPWTDLPAPQPGDRDHYETFLNRICDAYTARFG
ncbi:MAG: hypothetical protein HY331_15340 [Chloroflexi bacterium]|nr:hypothetical protein [Chloroflexota bacterium]